MWHEGQDLLTKSPWENPGLLRMCGRSGLSILGHPDAGALPRPANEPVRGDGINLGESGDTTVKRIKESLLKS